MSFMTASLQFYLIKSSRQTSMLGALSRNHSVFFGAWFVAGCAAFKPQCFPQEDPPLFCPGFLALDQFRSRDDSFGRLQLFCLHIPSCTQFHLTSHMNYLVVYIGQQQGCNTSAEDPSILIHITLVPSLCRNGLFTRYVSLFCASLFQGKRRD